MFILTELILLFSSKSPKIADPEKKVGNVTKKYSLQFYTHTEFLG